MIIDAMQVPIRHDENDNWTKLRDYQHHVVTGARLAYARKHNAVLLVMPTGAGKCLAPGTPVLMYNGTIKPVEQIQAGELVMGPDSLPRRVVGLARGREAMYRIVPTKGDPYTVNESHILSFRNERGLILNISVRQMKNHKSMCAELRRLGFQGWRVPGVLKGDTTPELTGIKIEPVGEGDYYGFELEGPDRLFLLGDFTVTHNTRTSCYIIDQAIARGRKVLILVHRQELAKQFSEALTDYGVRHGFIGPGAPFEVGKNVQVASVQTLVKRMDRLPWRPDLIVIDEAHHCTEGSSWGKVIDRYMHAVIIGLSATPERLDGKGLGRGHGGYFDAMVVGPTPAFLIDRGNLCPYRIYGTDATPDMTGVKRTGGDFNRGEAEARVDRPFITGSAVAHYRKLAAGKRAVVFCVSRRHAEHVAAEFCQAGLRFVVVDGTLSDDERERRVKQLETHEIDGIVSVDLISEGFDLPAIECAISLRPTQSTSLWVQQIGRVLRPSAGKDFAIILDHVGNTNRHGLPDDLREWSLEGRPKKAGKTKEKAEDPVKQCERCFSVHRPAPRCPMCGYEYEVKGRDIAEVEGELKEIETAKKRLERRQLLSKCRTYDDFLQVASQLGYKPGWARIQFDLRQKRRPGSAGQVAQQHSLP